MKSVKFNPLTSLVMAVALAIGLAGCGGGSDTVTEPMEPMEPMKPMEPMEPMPVAASGYITLTADQEEALLEVLQDHGDSATLRNVGVGADGVVREGVTFTCVSDYDCTVTVSNSAGTIVAMWKSQTLGAGTADAMAMGHEPPPETDPLAELNEGGASAITAIINVAIDAEATAETPETPRGAYSGDNNVLGGLGLGEAGVMNIKGVTLKSSLNPNEDDYDSTAQPPAPAGGSMVMAMNEDGTYADYDEDAPNATVALEGWNHKVLFRDWGDTATGGDGGFETGALIYSDMGAPTPDVPFDHDLVDMFVTPDAKLWFDLTARFAASDNMTSVVGDAVSIMVSDEADDQTKNMMFTVGAPQLETLANTVEPQSVHRGTYFGAMGTFKCVQEMTGCGIKRAEGGATPFGVALATTGTINWMFKPDPDATIDVPDQDWMVYGAWLTTPDAANGIHRVGVFFNGMDEYANTATTNVFTVGDNNGLRGSATYSGGAAGVYVDGDESGMFTARASLTANFDQAGNATNTPDTVPADVDDYMLSGRIDDFKRTDDTYLGTDTEDMPNDPTAGGENDWVVLLGAATLDTTVATSGSVMGSASGSADGVGWSGEWNAQLYGPGNVIPGGKAPTGVAGDFRVSGEGKGVVGAFGATKDE